MIADEAALHALLGRVAMQDRRALRELYTACAGRLLAVALRMLDNRAAAEDVVQDTFFTVWTRAPQFPTLRASPMAWLTSITRNRAIDVLRSRRPETPLEWRSEDGEEHHHDVADESASPLERLIEQQCDGRLAHCMGALEVEPRQAVALAYYEGLTHEEVASRMQRPLGTVKAWVRRSLQRLKDCVGELA